MIISIVIITSTAFPLKSYMSAKNGEWTENDSLTDMHSYTAQTASKDTATQKNFYACWQYDRRAFLYVFEKGTKKKYLWMSIFISFSEGNTTAIWHVHDIMFLTLTTTPSEWENGFKREEKQMCMSL